MNARDLPYYGTNISPRLPAIPFSRSSTTIPTFPAELLSF